jgi:DNA polymerase III alpha subunit (gram-positive type)
MNRTVVIDVETAGLDLSRHPIIQVAATVVDDSWREIGATFEAKIQFDLSVAEPTALELNSYDAATWALEAKPAPLVTRELGLFLREHSTVRLVSSRTGKPYSVARLCGHNLATFDLPAIERLFKFHCEFFPVAWNACLDTLQLARWVFAVRDPKPASFKLADLCAWYEIELEGAHDAFADVKATACLARALALEVKREVAA